MAEVKEVVPKNKKKTAKKVPKKAIKTDETLLKDAKKRIARLQKKKRAVKPKGKVKKNGLSIKEKKKKPSSRGVVYLGHLPHGFYEAELKGFFSQFGKVQRVKVSRSSKTGKSKGYAFIEFLHNDVAKIVAETMNNYLMFERLVKAQYIPPQKVDSRMFPKRFMTPDSYPTLLRRNKLKAKQETVASSAKKDQHRDRINFKIVRAVNLLKDLGINYVPQFYDPESKSDIIPENSTDELVSDEVPELVAIAPADLPLQTPEKLTKKKKKVANKSPGAANVTKKSLQTPDKRTKKKGKKVTKKSSGVTNLASQPILPTPEKEAKVAEKVSETTILATEPTLPTPDKSEKKEIKAKAVKQSRKSAAKKEMKSPATTPEARVTRRTVAKSAPKPSPKPSPKPGLKPGNTTVPKTAAVGKRSSTSAALASPSLGRKKKSV